MSSSMYRKVLEGMHDNQRNLLDPEIKTKKSEIKSKLINSNIRIF